MGSKEIITIQCGHAANFVGTHFWNAQDYALDRAADNATMNDASSGGVDDDPLVDAAYLYRHGLSIQGHETLMPRLVLCDLKGSLGSLSHSSPFYDSAPSTPATAPDFWSGEITSIQVGLKREKNAFLKYLDGEGTSDMALDDGSAASFAPSLSRTVQVWSDFTRVYYHPKSMVELPEYTHNSEDFPFATFSKGAQLYHESHLADLLMEDRLRFFLEECDAFQGFHVLTSVNDGFSGFTNELLAGLQETFGKSCVFVTGIHEPFPSDGSGAESHLKKATMGMNQALAAHRFAEQSSLYLPLYSPTCIRPCAWSKYLNKMGSMYEWTGYVASALSTITLPWRLIPSAPTRGLRMDDMVNALSFGGVTKVSALTAAIPLPMNKLNSIAFKQFLQIPRPHTSVKGWCDLTLQLPHDVAENVGAHFSVLRGAATGAPGLSLSDCRDVADQFCQAFPALVNRSIVLQKACGVSEACPQFFNTDYLTSEGLLKTTKGHEPTTPPPSSSKQDTMITSYPSMVRLRMSPRIASLLKHYRACLATLNTRVRYEFTKQSDVGSLDMEDFKEANEALSLSICAYEELGEDFYTESDLCDDDD